jgi:hypothetical protein
MTEMLNQDSRPDSGQGLTREAWLHRAIETFRPRFDEVGLPLPGKLHVSVGFGYSSRAESKYILGQCWARRASADGVAAAPPASKAAPQTPRLAGRVCQAREGDALDGAGSCDAAHRTGFLPVEVRRGRGMHAAPLAVTRACLAPTGRPRGARPGTKSGSGPCTCPRGGPLNPGITSPHAPL